MNIETIETVSPNERILENFSVSCVACLILTQDKKLLFQQRDLDCHRYPNSLGPFGGRIELGEQPIDCLVRELQEELGAHASPSTITFLDTITKPNAEHKELIYNYFWEDSCNTITGCYEGKAKRFDNIQELLTHPNVLNDVKWLLQSCQNKGFIEK